MSLSYSYLRSASLSPDAGGASLGLKGPTPRPSSLSFRRSVVACSLSGSSSAESDSRGSSDSSSSSSSGVGTSDMALPVTLPDNSNSSSSSDATRQAALHTALQRLTEQGVEEAANKYGLHEELFAELDFARVNAFSQDPFGGNPAAVVYLPYMPADQWLQAVAKEFNLSETAYLVRRRIPAPSSGAAGGAGRGAALLSVEEEGGSVKAVSAKESAKVAATRRRMMSNEFDLRWFTPESEVKLCGHATLASAHLLFTAGLLEPDCNTVVFHTLSGPLTARQVAEEESLFALRGAQAEGEGNQGAAATGKSKGGERRPKGQGIIELCFPCLPLTPVPVEEWAGLEAVLGYSPGSISWVGRNSLHYLLVEVGSEQQVVEVEPDFEALKSMPFFALLVTSLTARHTSNGRASSSAPSRHQHGDFVARFFAPAAGLDEDPVTGSAFCSLGPYWAHKLGQTHLIGFQASGRGGEVAVSVDEAGESVRLQGWAVMTQAGVLMNTMAPRVSTPSSSP